MPSEPLKIFNRAELIPEDADDTPYHEALAEQTYLSLRAALKRINELDGRLQRLEDERQQMLDDLKRGVMSKEALAKWLKRQKFGLEILICPRCHEPDILPEKHLNECDPEPPRSS